jgi:energy-coupling factor transport system permease protein
MSARAAFTQDPARAARAVGSARGFHARTWLLWFAAAGAVVLAIDNPLVIAIALVALGLVTARFAATGPEARSYAFLLKLGLVFVVARAVLFGLTGHVGETTLFVLPRVGLPGWLGGFSLGGRVTAEVVVQSAVEGLEIAAFLACFGVFLSVVETYRVLRLLPRFLFEAGLVACIAISFIPSLMRSAAEIRDAQRLRGHRFRGLRSLRPLVAPVLAGALERSLTLAASMESRGYGRARAGRDAEEWRARAGTLAGLLAATAGGGMFLYGQRATGSALALAGAVGLSWSLWRLSGAVARTRYSAERADAGDRALAVVCLLLIALSFLARSLDAAHWYAHPVLRWPEADPRLVALAVSLVAPVVVASIRDVILERASARHPVLDERFPAPEKATL